MTSTENEPDFANLEQELVDRNCILRSGVNVPPCHFVGTSDHHLEDYVNLDPIFPHTAYLRKLVRAAVEPHIIRADSNGTRTGAVVTPEVGSIPLAVLASEVIMEAQNRDNVLGLWADKIPGSDGKVDFRISRPGFMEALIAVVERGEQVLVVEDYINRQHSVSRVVRAVGNVVGKEAVAGVATVAANSGVSAESLDVPLYTQLCEVSYRTWSPEACLAEGPCSQRLPVVVDAGIGHGAKFQQENPDYLGGFIQLRTTVEPC